MFMTAKSNDKVRKYLESNRWQLDTLYPGPEAFYPRKDTAPHLHFTMQAPYCHLHYKAADGVITEINSSMDARAVPGMLMQIEARGLVLHLTMG